MAMNSQTRRLVAEAITRQLNQAARIQRRLLKAQRAPARGERGVEAADGGFVHTQPASLR
jgi:hypothetical protein